MLDGIRPRVQDPRPITPLRKEQTARAVAAWIEEVYCGHPQHVKVRRSEAC